MKLIIGLLLLLSLCSCRKEEPLRGEELCRQIKEIESPWNETRNKIDSLVRLSEKLSPAEHYAVILRAASACYYHRHDSIAALYLQNLDTLPFPGIDSKAAGFLLMEQYAFRNISAQPTDSKVISALLFDMENRQRLTPEEKCRFLALKAGIYRSVFQEYSSAATVIREAKNIARQHKITGKILCDIHILFQQCYYPQSDSTQAITSHCQELLATLGNLPDDSITRQMLYKTLIIQYSWQKDYHKAWHYMQQLKSKPQQLSQLTVDIYIGIDSIPQLLAYLEKERANVTQSASRARKSLQEQATHICLAKITYAEARAYRHLGDTSRYRQALYTSVCHLEQISKLQTSFYDPREAYARLLWEEGKRSEAIRQMEQISRGIISGRLKIGNNAFGLIKRIAEQQISRLQLLADYYREAGRTADALRQAQLCDSLQNEYNQSRLRTEKKENASRMYTADLNRNLELQRANYEREQQKLTFIAILLSLTLIAASVFAILYRRRQKELNAIYARQKEIEQLETTLASAQNPALREEFPADKQLYLRLEKQMRDEQLYLNPDFSRDDLCRLAGSNRMYVSTSINKYAEMNLNQWINKARVNHAIHLIRSGETNLQVLAEASGFSSSTSFFRNFRQFTLLSPKQYMEREKKRTANINT